MSVQVCYTYYILNVIHQTLYLNRNINLHVKSFCITNYNEGNKNVVFSTYILFLSSIRSDTFLLIISNSVPEIRFEF